MTQLSEEQRLMRQSCRDFVDDVVLPFIRHNWQREWLMTPEDRLPPEILAGADKIGIRTLGVPEEFGGVELDPGDRGADLRPHLRGDRARRFRAGRQAGAELEGLGAAAQSGAAPPAGEMVQAPDGGPAIPAGALPDRAARRLRPLAPLQRAGSRHADPRGQADGKEWVVNGRKQFISNGYDAGLYVVYANTNPKVGMLQGTSSFLVPRDTPGLTVARCNETLGCRFMNNGELVFEDMRVPEDHLLVENDALGKAGVYFRPGKIIQASKNLGVGVRAFEVTADYVQNYVQGGRILIKHQAVALRLADMATRIEAVRALLDRAAGRSTTTRRRRHAVQHGQAVRFRGDHEGRAARGRAARRQRHDARFRHREAAARRRHLSAHGRHGGHLEAEDRQIDVSGDGRQVRRAGIVLSSRRPRGRRSLD